MSISMQCAFWAIHAMLLRVRPWLWVRTMMVAIITRACRHFVHLHDCRGGGQDPSSALVVVVINLHLKGMLSSRELLHAKLMLPSRVPRERATRATKAGTGGGGGEGGCHHKGRSCDWMHLNAHSLAEPWPWIACATRRVIITVMTITKTAVMLPSIDFRTSQTSIVDQIAIIAYA